MEHRHPLIAGALAGAAEIICTYPLEYIKTQLQIAGPAISSTSVSSRTTTTVAFRNSRDVVQQTIHRHGYFGLYRGLSPNLYFSFPKCAIRFAAFEYTARYLRDGTWDWSLSTTPPSTTTIKNNSSNSSGTKLNNNLNLPQRALTPLQSFTAGLVSGVIEALFVIIPMTTIQVKFITDLNRSQPEYKHFFHGISSIYRYEGIQGLYRGASPTLLKIAINMSFRFLIYNELTLWLTKQWNHWSNPHRDGDAAVNSSSSSLTSTGVSRSTVISMTAGALAGAITVVGNHPIDVVKSYMQAQTIVKSSSSFSPSSASSSIIYTSARHCLSSIYRTQGIRGLYAGLIPRLNRVILETSLSFTFYQHFSVLANQYIDGYE